MPARQMNDHYIDAHDFSYTAMTVIAIVLIQIIITGHNNNMIILTT